MALSVVLLLHAGLFALLLRASPPAPPAVVQLPTLTGMLLAPVQSAAAAVPQAVKTAATETEVIKSAEAPPVPALSKPKPIKANPIEPNPIEPNPIEPNPIEPSPIEPSPIEPSPIEPSPIEPRPSQPKPSEPKPNLPKPATTASTSSTAPTSTTASAKTGAVAASAADAAPLTLPRVDASQLNNPAPAYPPLSRRLREQGVVMLEVLIQADGRVGALRIKHSSGFKRLDDAARQAVQRWRYLPATRAGVAIDYWYLQPIEFSLTN